MIFADHKLIAMRRLTFIVSKLNVSYSERTTFLHYLCEKFSNKITKNIPQ